MGKLNIKFTHPTDFELLEIPFPLKGGPYKNIIVQIEVLDAEKELLKYIDSAVLSLVPDLRL
jgi:hypothetical protein